MPDKPYRNLKTDYDVNRSKPSHERAVADPRYQSATRGAVKAENERKLLWDKENFRKTGGRFIDYQNFVPLDPMESLDGRESRVTSKLTYTVVGVIGAWLLISFLTIGGVMKLLNSGLIAAMLFDIVMGIVVMYVALSRFVFKVDNKRRSRAMQVGNKSMNLGQIWGINPGGIMEENIRGKKSTTVYYTGVETIVLKMLKKSVLVSEETADWEHYQSLQRLEDILSANRYKFTKINTKFAPDNDTIWDELDDNLGRSSRILGKEYTDVMSEILDYQYRYTVNNSNVSVVYYIIQPVFMKPTRPFKDLIPELMYAVSNARCTLGTVTNKEYIRLLRDYYGVNYLDMDSITDFLSANVETPNIEVKLIKYVDDQGNLIELKDYFEPRIPSEYKTTESIRREKDLKVDDKIDIREQLTVFGDKSIVQRKS